MLAKSKTYHDDAFPQPVIGLDLGGTNITGGLVDENNRIVARTKIDTEASAGADHVLERIAHCVETLIKSSDFTRKDILGVGLAVPGVINAEKGIVLEAVNLRWNNLKIQKKLKERIPLPVTLDNDVNAGCWGEYKLGAGRGASNLLAIFVGTGIGGGIVLNDQLVQGAFNSAGEIGHVWVETHGQFGSRTLEELCSRTAIVHRLVRMVDANHPSELRDLAGKKWPRIRSKVLSRALKADDELTITVLRDAAKVIGRAAAGWTTMMNFERIIIGGGLTEALDERWIQWIEKYFNHSVFPTSLKDRVQITPSSLGDDAGLYGAALLARDRLKR